MTSRLSPSAATSPDVVTASSADAAAPGVNLSAGLTSAAVEALREAHGYNEVTERPEHPVLRFLSKFWGLSAVLRKHSDLVVVTALLVLNAVLSFAQERRAAGAQGIVEQLTRARFFGPIVRLELIPLEDHKQTDNLSADSLIKVQMAAQQFWELALREAKCWSRDRAKPAVLLKIERASRPGASG